MISLLIVSSLAGFYQIIRHSYEAPSTQEDIFIASKQCSQYTLGSQYLEVGHVYRYIDLDGEEKILQYDRHRLVKTPGYEILLFDIDNVSFDMEEDLIYMTIQRDNKNYRFLLTYAQKQIDEDDEKEDEISDETDAPVENEKNVSPQTTYF